MRWTEKTVSMNVADKETFKSRLAAVTVSENRIRVEPNDVEDWGRILREFEESMLLEEVYWADVAAIEKTVEDLFYPHIDITLKEAYDDEYGVPTTQRIFFTEDEQDVLEACFKAIRQFWNRWRQHRVPIDERFKHVDLGDQPEEEVALTEELQDAAEDSLWPDDDADEVEIDPAHPHIEPPQFEIEADVTAFELEEPADEEAPEPAEDSVAPEQTSSADVEETEVADANETAAEDTDSTRDRYHDLVCQPIEAVKDAVVEDEDVDYGRLLHAEKEHKDRRSLRDWIKHRIRERGNPAEIVAMPIEDVKAAVREIDVEYGALLAAEQAQQNRQSLVDWLEQQREVANQAASDAEQSAETEGSSDGEGSVDDVVDRFLDQ